MRLLLCMISFIIMGLPYSAYAEDVKHTVATLTFTVDVLSKQCTVEIGPTTLVDSKVYLGTIPGKVGVVGPIVPIAFRFTDCKSVSSIQSIEFARDIGGYQGSELGGPDKGFVSTDITKVRIFLWEDSAGSKKFRLKTFNPAEPISSNAWVPVCYAQAGVVDVNGDGRPAPARTFEGRAEFTVTYN